MSQETPHERRQRHGQIADHYDAVYAQMVMMQDVAETYAFNIQSLFDRLISNEALLADEYCPGRTLLVDAIEARVRHRINRALAERFNALKSDHAVERGTWEALRSTVACALEINTHLRSDDDLLKRWDQMHPSFRELVKL
jgi:hypothetical protein